MFASLDSVDTLIEEDGVKVAIQADDRAPTDIERTRDISTIFAITRVVASRILAPTCHYAMVQEPPDWFRTLLIDAGAHIRFGMEPPEPAGPTKVQALEHATHVSMTRLGRLVASRHGWSFDASGMARAQHLFHSLELDSEEDEERFWTAVVELSAFCSCVLMHIVDGAKWVLYEESDSVIPLMLKAPSGAYLNVIMRCERVFREGPAHGPTTFFDLSLIHI